MADQNYNRLLQAIYLQVKMNGMANKATKDLDKVLELDHPVREMAFVEWALSSDMCKKPVASGSRGKITPEQISL